jgi:hypothetical protein
MINNERIDAFMAAERLTNNVYTMICRAIDKAKVGQDYGPAWEEAQKLLGELLGRLETLKKLGG